MKSNQFRTLLKKLIILTNFWPAALVVFALGLTLSQTVPVLKKLPERLVMTEVNAAEEKPALPDPEEEKKEEQEDSGNTYEDGVYTGSSSGYGGKVTVQVTVKERRIAEVDVLSAPGETAEFLAKAKGVINRVIQAQTWDVDVISGATYSSRGILGAIQNALTGEKVENEAPPEQKGPVAPITKIPFDDNVTWKDGVYIGSAKGYGGTIEVEVTIRQAKIAAIRVLKHGGETDSYYNKAKSVINRILKAGTPNVDTISGATYSSNGIINAVKNALKKAAGGSAPDPADPSQNPAKKPSQGNNQEEEDPNLENGLKDGTYTADVVCTDDNIFEYTIRLTMVVKNGKIISLQAVRIDDRSDNPEMNATYLGYAVSGRTDGGKTWPGVIAQILKLQTTKDVDVVSGATYSSKAILNGVKKMLRQAAKNPSEEENDPAQGNEGTDSGSESDNTEPSPDEKEDQDGDDEQENTGYGDGTYVAEAYCVDSGDDPAFEYTVRTTIVIEDGKIVSIDVERINDISEDPDTNTLYLNYAVNGRTRKGVEYRGIVSQILDQQDTGNIDIVSGATYSSKAILDSVEKALSEAAAAYTAPGQDDGDDSGEGSGTGSTGAEGSGEGSGTGSTDAEGSGEGSGTGSTGDEGSGTGSTDDEGSGEGSDTGSTGTEGSGEGSGTGSTDDEGSGEGSSAGSTGAEGSGEGSSTGNTGEEKPAEEKNTNKYLDGTYSATASCKEDNDDPLFDYKVKMTIVIKDGEIKDVSVKITDDDSEDPESNDLYFGYAADGRSKGGRHYTGIPDQIKEKQDSSGLDAVSGATYSSKAMISAAKKALSEAENPDAE